MHAVGLSVVGAYFALSGASVLLGRLGLALFYRSTLEFEWGIGVASAKLGLGLLVFLGAPGIVGLWRTLRSRGHEELGREQG
jgi:hypothetical protein